MGAEPSADGYGNVTYLVRPLPLSLDRARDDLKPGSCTAREAPSCTQLVLSKRSVFTRCPRRATGLLLATCSLKPEILQVAHLLLALQVSASDLATQYFTQVLPLFLLSFSCCLSCVFFFFFLKLVLRRATGAQSSTPTVRPADTCSHLLPQVLCLCLCARYSAA